MPLVRVDVRRGKPDSYLSAVSNAVHASLVEGLGMLEEDRFQVFTQHDDGELVFSPTFRTSGRRTDDWLLITVVDGVDRGPAAKAAFYRLLVDRLAVDPGVAASDVFVVMQRGGRDDFSFGGGVPGTEIAAAEAIQQLTAQPARRSRFTDDEILGAISEFLGNQNADPLIAMLPSDFVFSSPASLPYGGDFVGPDAFRDYLDRVQHGGSYWASLVTTVREIVRTDGNVFVPIVLTATGKTSGKTIEVDNFWHFKTRGGVIRSARNYADTAAGQSAVG